MSARAAGPRTRRRGVRAWLTVAAVAITPVAAAAADGWNGARLWWRADRPVARWSAPHPAVAGAVRWHAARPGLEVGELRLTAGDGRLLLRAADAAVAPSPAALPVRVVLARLDPARHALRLAAAARPGGGAGPWDVGRAPAEAALALNAGQFTDAGPWGWVVHRGRVRQAPGSGALAGALVVDTAGRARIVGADSVRALHAAMLAGDRAIAEAVQSYPTLLDGDGEVPAALRPSDAALLDLDHRDARLVACELRDGRLLVALTRFDGIGADDGAGAVRRAVDRTVARLPIGLTVPETAALAGALGCRRALLLDGGLSAQLLVRDASGTARRWDGLRGVPLGLVALPR